MIKIALLNGEPEIFHTIQGEGKNIGKPSIFIRLSLCNLYCIWCDTDYTWNWEGTRFTHKNECFDGYKKHNKRDSVIELTNEQIVHAVAQIDCNNLVITGGEPLVQQKEIVSLLASLRTANPNYHIEFETNGTIKPSEDLENLTDQYNVSLKLSNSNVQLSDREKPEAIIFFANTKKSNFKFVMDTIEDLNEVLSLIQRYKITPQTVYLMPQGTSVLTIKDKQQWLVEICKAYNLNYTDRLHIHIWGNKRGI